MPFHTVVSCSSPGGVVAERPSLQRAIFRPKDYHFTAQDYIAYEHVRQYFLGQRIARAALMKGGITWRLAYEFMNPGVVLEGPGALTRAYAQGYVLADPCPRGAYVDDELTDEELWVLVGGYCVPTDQENSDQTKLLSWWPRPSLWARSAYELGIWTPAAEEWYQNLVSKYRQGTQQPRSGREWEKVISNASRRRKVAHTRTRLAMEDVLLHHQ
jgi:hypothetical protein